MKHAVCAITLLVAPLLAQQPKIADAKLQTRASAGLEKEIRAFAGSASGPAWVAWSVPKVAGRSHNCSASLEDGSTRNQGGDDSSGAVDLLVFLRVNGGAIDRIRGFDSNCEIDGDGRSVLLLTGVKPAESVAYLSTFAAADTKKMRHSAVFAVAQHAGPEAEAALDRFLEPNQPEDLREQTVFWLGAARGRPGYERLRKIVRDDPSDHIRDKAVFALYVSHVPESADAIIEAAKNDKSPRVRGQALFWVAQKASKKAAAAITDAIENDPDTEIKKKAVFALSQMPKDEGVPRLIQVAKANRNPAVRKQAMFWLGQSRDPRALEFFEAILTGK